MTALQEASKRLQAALNDPADSYARLRKAVWEIERDIRRGASTPVPRWRAAVVYVATHSGAGIVGYLIHKALC